jgi:hypothetical protein
MKCRYLNNCFRRSKFGYNKAMLLLSLHGDMPLAQSGRVSGSCELSISCAEILDLGYTKTNCCRMKGATLLITELG